MLQSAVEHYARQQRITAAALVALRREKGGPLALARILTAFQILAARDAASSVPLMLEDQGIAAPPVAIVAPTSIAGVASDGRPLDTLVDLGQSYGPSWFDMMAASQIQDAARSSASLAIAVRPSVSGWVRMMNPPSCSRCAVLAGKFFRWNQGFQRHPQCFPAGVMVSGPSTEAASRRWYQGELVVFRTASGKELPVTGNHPVLTNQGWVPANLLRVGDHVVRSLGGQGATALVVPDEQQAPALIEDVWRSSGMVSLGEVPTTTEDFHGDGGHGEVDIVFADRLLRDGLDAAGPQRAHQEQLSGRVAQPFGFSRGGSSEKLLHRVGDAPDRFVRGSGLGRALIRSHSPGADHAGFGHVPDLDTAIAQALSDDAASDAVSEAERVLAFASAIRRRDVGARQRDDSPRWDAPAGPLTVETRGAYAGRGQDLGLRLSGQVATDRVVELRRVEWSGHVYNLTSSEGWYSANDLIVSNCDCRHIPSQEADYSDERLSGDKWFHTLSPAEQDRIFTKAGAQAVRDGADLNQIVNARRGMDTIAYGNRTAIITREGVTTRGVAGRNFGEYVKLPGNRYRTATRPRVMPETIYAIPGITREEAIRLLKLNGFIF